MTHPLYRARASQAVTQPARARPRFNPHPTKLWQNFPQSGNSPPQHTELTNTVAVTATPPASSLPNQAAPSAQNTLSLLDLLLVLVKYRKMLIGIKEIGPYR